jgi:hypothetical protein
LGPKVDGELQKLGFVVSERTVARYLRSIPTSPRSWETVAGVSAESPRSDRRLRLLHGADGQLSIAVLLLRYRAPGRKILHLHVTRHPSADWVVQQIGDAFPEAGSYRYVILDRDGEFDDSVTTFLQTTGLTAKRTSGRAPWQNGTAERWIGSRRRELLDHIC